MRKTSAYKVKVKTDDHRETSFEIDDKYYDCESGEIFILTDNPEDIYRAIGNDIVESIEKVGVGYIIREGKK